MEAIAAVMRNCVAETRAKAFEDAAKFVRVAHKAAESDEAITTLAMLIEQFDALAVSPTKEG